MMRNFEIPSLSVNGPKLTEIDVFQFFPIFPDFQKSKISEKTQLGIFENPEKREIAKNRCPKVNLASFSMKIPPIESSRRALQAHLGFVSKDYVEQKLYAKKMILVTSSHLTWPKSRRTSKNQNVQNDEKLRNSKSQRQRTKID